MTEHAMRYTDGHRRFTTLTDLNLRTNVAYYACQMTGGHVPSGDSVRRWFPGADCDLPICGRCGVPYNAPRGVSWTTGATRGPRPTL